MQIPGVIMMLTVIFWSQREGLTGGAVSAVLSIFYLALHYRLKGNASLEVSSSSKHLLLWALCLPIAALLVGTASRRSERLFGPEQEKKRLEGQDLASKRMIHELGGAQHELTERERLHHFLADTMPHLVWIADFSGTSHYFNRRWLDFAGKSLEECLAGGWREAFHSEDLERRMRDWEEMLHTGRGYEREYRLRKAADGTNGEWRWHLARAEPFRDSNGSIVQWAETCIDIHEQRIERDKLTRDVRSARRTMDSILAFSLDIICTVDRKARIVRISKACEKILGYHAEELAGRSLLEMIHPQDRESAARMHKKILEGSSQSGLMRRWIRKNGTIIPLVWSANWDKDEQIMVCIGRDVSEMRKANGELKAANKAAKKANAAKTEFLANMNHEIRTPMNGVLGMTSLLRETALNSEQREFVEIIRRSGEMLLTIINDILDFSKIEAGKMIFENVEFNLLGTLANCAELLGATSQQRNVLLSLEIAPDVPAYLTGDAGRLQQVLTNLLSNAVRFTGSGGKILVLAEMERREETEAVLRFRVTDSGIGIDAETQKRLFEPFTQVDATTTRKYGGTGLGLAICRKLVNLMGGEIGVESRTGEGATFYFTARFGYGAQTSGVTAAGETGLPAEDNGNPASLGRKESLLRKPRLLIAEDNHINQKVAILQLRRLGYEADVAGNGMEVLAAMEHSPYDIILMDCQMPEMDGYETALTIRKTRPVPQPYIIALTANSMAGDRERCLASGMNDYVTKPVRSEDLAEAIGRWAG